MASADLYEILGVGRDVSQDDLKKSYRRLARELHPDANPDDPTAEARFKEVSQAYEILSDPERRANYDRFGGESPFGQGFQSGSVQDIFDLFFGNMNQSGRSRGPQSGPDAEIAVEITLFEAAFGVTRDVDITVPTRCEQCEGSGAAPGTSPTACGDCNGTGELRRVRNSFLGQMMTTTPCARCRGTGELISTPCSTCRGDGRVSASKTLSLEIPAGVEQGSTMRLVGRGPAGPRGGPNGTLYVHLRVSEDSRFERVGDDLHHVAEIEVTQAILGAMIEVPTLDGTITLDVTPGTQPGAVQTLRHQGTHHLRGRGRGDLYVHLSVKIPTDLDAESEKLVRDLATQWGHSVHEGGSKIFSRLRGSKR